MKDVLCKAFCDNVQVRRVPVGFAVSTGFVARTGDRIGFYMRESSSGDFRIEDDGTTLPTLEASGLDFKTGTRKAAMESLLQEYGVKIDAERREFFVSEVPESAVPAVAMKFVAFLLRVRDFTLMTEANVLSTFREDVRKQLSETFKGRAQIQENAPILPTLADAPADFVLIAPNRPPVGVFLGTTDARILQALVLKMRADYEVHQDCSIIGLLERGRNVSENVRQQASNRLRALPIYRGDEAAAIQKIVSETLGSEYTLQ